MKNTMGYSQGVSFYPPPPPADFDSERSLWDSVVLGLISQGDTAENATNSAKTVILDRRKMFNDKQEGEV